MHAGHAFTRGTVYTWSSVGCFFVFVGLVSFVCLQTSPFVAMWGWTVGWVHLNEFIVALLYILIFWEGGVSQPPVTGVDHLPHV